MCRKFLYKEDWANACERIRAWWDGEFIDRPVIQVTSPRMGVEHVQNELNDEWRFVREPSDPEVAIKNFEKWCAKFISEEKLTLI